MVKFGWTKHHLLSHAQVSSVPSFGLPVVSLSPLASISCPSKSARLHHNIQSLRRAHELTPFAAHLCLIDKLVALDDVESPQLLLFLLILVFRCIWVIKKKNDNSESKFRHSPFIDLALISHWFCAFPTSSWTPQLIMVKQAKEQSEWGEAERRTSARRVTEEINHASIRYWKEN